MKVLFIGGTGIISSACAQLAVERGIDLYLLNRGRGRRPVPESAHLLVADIRDGGASRDTLGTHTFDAVVDFVAYTPDQVQADVDLLRGRIGQYIFISSASAYQKPPSGLPITESTVLCNPYWQYSRNKIACEDLLVQAYRNSGFPITIVRPSHTYDKMSPPVQGGYTVIDRLRRGKQIVVHGDGTSLWVVTHHKDVAKGLVGLLGNAHALGESFHITSDELLTWNQIHEALARAAGVEAHIVHVPSDYIRACDADWGDGLIGDKAHSAIFDNSKIKRFVPDFVATIPFAQGADEIVAWYDGDQARRIIDPAFDQLCDRIVATYASIWPTTS
jgi:nucleoside-diphosphate-sugar epimerase